MRIFKCKDCSHEIILSHQPIDCDICGGDNFIQIIKDITVEGGTDTMAIDRDLFSSSRFRSTIQSYCREIGWKISDINDRRAVLIFSMDSGVDQTLYIIRYENTLEFSCPTGVKFNDLDEVPHYLSTMLLSKNSQFKIGFWCIEEIGEQQVFSVMHNAEMSLIEINYFYKVVLKLVQECDEFEQAIERLLE